MKRRIIGVIVAALAVATAVIAYRLCPPSRAARVAAQHLSTAHTFCIGGGGITGRISDDEDSLFVLLSSHRAADLLSEVFEGGSPEAKSYALCGLHYVAPKRFDGYAAEFATARVRVQTLSGCIGGEHEPAEIIAALRTNAFEHYLPLRKEIESNRRRLDGANKARTAR